jgi:hypothetical protein
MWPVSGRFLAAATSSHGMVVQADVSKGGRRLFTGLPVVAGTVAVDARRDVRRTVDLTVAPRLRTGTYDDVPALPRSPGDVLGHYGQQVTVRWGLRYPSGQVEWCPVGVFRIDEVSGSLLDQSAVRIRAVSREAHVVDDRFAAPRTVSGPSALALIEALIRETLPQAVVVPRVVRDRRVPPTTFDEDRWAAVRTLAAGIGAVVYADPSGRFVIEPAPTLSSRPVWTVAGGPGGVLVSADTSSSREQVYNRVVVRGDNPASGLDPVSAEARDDRVDSPTRWGDPDAGAYGRVTRFMYLPTVTTTAQALDAARAQLARSTGAAASVDLSTVPNVALEGLDVLDIVTGTGREREVRRHVVDSARFGLTAGAPFTVQTRDLGQEAAS